MTDRRNPTEESFLKDVSQHEMTVLMDNGRMPDTQVKERPILFSAPMVRAVLNGSKTQTRRTMKPQPHPNVESKFPFARMHGEYVNWHEHADLDIPMYLYTIKCPYGKPGDCLWVKETYSIQSVDNHSARISYRERMPAGKTLADTDGGLDIVSLSTEELIQADRLRDPERWRPSIFMPRWASRITLEIVDVRVERLNSISEEDAKAEGCRAWKGVPGDGEMSAVQAYSKLWDSINGEGAWDKNSWVWCLTFRRLEVR